MSITLLPSTVGVDFVLTSEDVMLHPNAPRSCVTVSIIDDIITENTEHFELSIVTNSSSVIVTGPNATISIEDDDCKFAHFMYFCYYCYILFCHT